MADLPVMTVGLSFAGEGEIAGVDGLAGLGSGSAIQA
jgi:hypothetical protein